MSILFGSFDPPTENLDIRFAMHCRMPWRTRHWQTICHPTAVGARRGRRSHRNTLCSAPRTAAADVALAAQRSTVAGRWRQWSSDSAGFADVTADDDNDDNNSSDDETDAGRPCVDCTRYNERKCLCPSVCVCVYLCVPVTGFLCCLYVCVFCVVVSSCLL